MKEDSEFNRIDRPDGTFDYAPMPNFKLNYDHQDIDLANYNGTFIGGYDLAEIDLRCFSTEQLHALDAALWPEASIFVPVESSQKVFMNSIYGATGSKHFGFKHPWSAGDITAEGRYYIKDGDKAFNWFIHNFHTLTELHEKLYNDERFKQYFGYDITKNSIPALSEKKDYVVYTDTDSIYTDFEDLFDAIQFDAEKGPYDLLIVAMNDLYLKDHFDRWLGGSVERRHGENFLIFDLEAISHSAFFMAKKKYVQTLKWSDGVILENPFDNVKGKGVEIIQSGMGNAPKMLLKKAISLLFQGKLTNLKYRAYMRKFYEMFEQFPIEQKCKYTNINDYRGKVINDTTGMEWQSRTLPQYRGAIKYNYLLKQAGLQIDYEPIGNNTRVCWYMDEQNQPFSFPWDSRPDEVRPKLDDKIMFDKLIARPLSRLVALAGINVDNYLDDTVSTSFQTDKVPTKAEQLKLMKEAEEAWTEDQEEDYAD